MIETIYLIIALSIVSICFLVSLYFAITKNKKSVKLQTELDQSKTDLVTIQERLSSKEQELINLNSNYETVRNQHIIAQKGVTSLTGDKKALESRLEEKETIIKSQNEDIRTRKIENSEFQSLILEREKAISELNTTLDLERQAAEEKLSLLDEAKEKLTMEFQNLGNKIFEDKSKKFTDQNKENLQTLLNPLREQIKDFDKKVSETYEKESKERVSLLTQIESLKNLNERIGQDAINLTNALKGETKTQGTWGEIVLERILEISGLEKGREFNTQETFRDLSGKIQRPDVIVHLPDGKDVIIDSKVSLTAYERYSSSESEEDRKQALRDHISSINSHIRDLSSKEYEELSEINTLNYVLMFIPIEAAYVVAIENDVNLFRNAFDKNIVIVCPSTLLSTLRTIQSIWQFEYQNRNAQKIADQAGKMYDRFVEFIGHVHNVGNRLTQATSAYDSAIKSLSEGKGNLVKRAEDLKKLGIKNKKSIPLNLLDKDEEGSEQLSVEDDTQIQLPEQN